MSMEDMSSTALLLTWTQPLCDYGVRTGYTVCTAIIIILSINTYTVYHRGLSHECDLKLAWYILMQITHVPIQLPIYAQGEEGQESSMFPSPYILTDPSATSFILSSLTPNTNYSISICATTVVGCSESTDAMGLTNEDGE